MQFILKGKQKLLVNKVAYSNFYWLFKYSDPLVDRDDICILSSYILMT